MTNREILEIAMQQSAIDANCDKDDFTRKDNVIVASKKHPNARKYLEYPMRWTLIKYGTNMEAQREMDKKDIVEGKEGK